MNFYFVFRFWFLDVRNHPVLIHCKRGKVQNLHLIALVSMLTFVVCVFHPCPGVPLVIIDVYSFVNGKYICCAIIEYLSRLLVICMKPRLFIVLSLMFKLWNISSFINRLTWKEWVIVYPTQVAWDSGEAVVVVV